MGKAINIVKKICMLGDPSVGKTSLVRRYVTDSFSDVYHPTIGTKVMKKVIGIGRREGFQQDIELTYLIFDLVGHSEFETITNTYIKGAEGALVVGDLLRAETLEHILKWESKLRDVVGKVPVIYVGNKNDLLSSSMHGRETMIRIAGDERRPFMFTSAKTGENVNQLFGSLAYGILKVRPY